MSKFEVGDRAKGKVSGDTYTVLGVHGDAVWASCETRPGYATLREDNLDKVEPFFEVDEKYILVGDTFEPVMVRENSNGMKVAFGKVSSGSRDGGVHYWRSKDETQFTAWDKI